VKVMVESPETKKGALKFGVWAIVSVPVSPW
jgi:hypothetical protein